MDFACYSGMRYEMQLMDAAGSQSEPAADNSGYRRVISFNAISRKRFVAIYPAPPGTFPARRGNRINEAGVELVSQRGTPVGSECAASTVARRVPVRFKVCPRQNIPIQRERGNGN